MLKGLKGSDLTDWEFGRLSFVMLLVHRSTTGELGAGMLSSKVKPLKSKSLKLF